MPGRRLPDRQGLSSALASRSEAFENVIARDQIGLAALGLAGASLLLGGGLLVGPLLLEPGGAEPSDALVDPFASADSTPIATGWLVVDVEGAVARPGLARLPAGARVADAIAAAGGYTAAADLLTAIATINLAEPLRDGQQVVVPILGSGSGSGSGGGGNPGGGLVDLNTASPEELDTLPGIGPVTVEKIVAAREEEPFTTLDELVTREVLTASQLEKIRDLVTLG